MRWRAVSVDDDYAALIETDEAALAQVRKDLAQTWTRFIARMLAQQGLPPAPAEAPPHD